MKLLMSCFTAIIFYIFSGIVIETGCVDASIVRSIEVTKITNPVSSVEFEFTLMGREDDANGPWETILPVIDLSHSDSFSWDNFNDKFEEFILTESSLPTGWFLQDIITEGGEEVEVDLINNRVIFELDDDKAGEFKATFQNAVPIPSAIWLMASGLIGIVGIRIKLKK